MSISLLGLPLTKTLERLCEAGVEDVSVQNMQLPREDASRGSLRVIRVSDGGKQLLVARFLDTAEEGGETV